MDMKPVTQDAIRQTQDAIRKTKAYQDAAFDGLRWIHRQRLAEIAQQKIWDQVAGKRDAV